jgi:acyl-CoA synthetase (NDP forming)
VHALQRLISPRSVAVVGGAAAEQVVRQCLKLGFPGPIWPVHPSRAEIAGVSCIASLDQLPDVPDAVFLGVNRHLTVQAMAALASIGAGGAVCYGSGFAETGEAHLQADLLAAAGDVPFLGPNCYGLVNTFDRVALWPDEHGCGTFPRGAAFVSQSGNVACNLTFQRRSVRMGMMLTVGNQAQLGVEDCIDVLLDDERITTIGLFLEAVRDAQRFSAAAQRAAAQGVPVVALHTGRSEVGATIAASHTGSMAGRADVYDALFERCGITVVRTPTELLETVKLLDLGGRLAGPRIVSLSCSGGEASLVADRSEGSALRFDAFDGEHRARIESTLTELVSVSNPFDYHTFMWGDRSAMAGTFGEVMDGPQDLTMLVLDAPTAAGLDPSAWYVAADALADAADATGRRAVVVGTMPECIDDAFQRRIVGRGVVPLLGLSEALTAIAASLPTLAPRAHHPVDELTAAGGHVLTEAEAKQRLAAAGLAVPHGVTATATEVDAAARAVGFPVTLKAMGIAHKSEAGAVRIGLADESAVGAALTTMPRAHEYLVERTVTDVVTELLVAVRRQPPIGLLVTIGYGGVTTEVWRDMVHLLAPVTTDEVVAAIGRLRCAPLLAGFRGGPPADVQAFASLVVALTELVVATGAVEVELNPVLVGSRGAVAVDALWTDCLSDDLADPHACTPQEDHP